MANFQPQNLKRIAVYTSGGDAPGMNAALRSVVRCASHKGIEVYGIRSGYVGMVEGKIEPLTPRQMANLIQRGGTALKTGRLPEFSKKQVRETAFNNLKSSSIDAAVCIGGDGSFRGAHELWKDFQFPVVGIPGTIDNDIWGTDSTVGFDTALNTALDAIDRIRDTAASHDRVFIVEVMGRNSGLIASHVGLAGGAEEIFAPDIVFSIDKTIERIRKGVEKGKLSSILVAAEGQKPGRAYDLAEMIRKKSGLDAKVCILGHQQRGGSPTASDRILASRMAFAAVDALGQGICDVMTALQGNEIRLLAFDEILKKEKPTPKEFLNLAQVLAN